MPTLKKIFDWWVCEGLEIFNILLELEVTTEDEQIPLETTEMDSLDFQMQLDDHLKMEKRHCELLFQTTSWKLQVTLEDDNCVRKGKRCYKKTGVLILFTGFKDRIQNDLCTSGREKYY